jgi:hypothetical protein
MPRPVTTVEAATNSPATSSELGSGTAVTLTADGALPTCRCQMRKSSPSESLSLLV